MHEFLSFLIQLAFSRDGAEAASLDRLLGGLRRSQKVAELKPLLESAKTDPEVAEAIAAGAPMLSAAFDKVRPARAHPVHALPLPSVHSSHRGACTVCAAGGRWRAGE